MSSIKISVPAGGTVLLDKSAMRKVMRGAGQDVVRKAKALIRAGGATAKRAAKRSSAAGGPPVNRTGNLARGIKLTMWRNAEGFTVKDIAQAARGSHAPYALFLEKGAVGGRGSGIKDKKGVRNAYKKINRKSVLMSVSSARVLAPHPFMYPAAEAEIAGGLGDRVRAALVSGLGYQRGSKKP
jgi:hypothetical protein